MRRCSSRPIQRALQLAANLELVALAVDGEGVVDAAKLCRIDRRARIASFWAATVSGQITSAEQDDFSSFSVT
jgi:hypothetical protein